MSQPKTMFQKIWDSHLVHKDDEGICILYIDRHLVHDGTSPQAFEGLRESGRKVRQPGLSLAVADHNVPTTDRSIGLDSIVEPESRLQVEALSSNCAQYEIELFEMLDKRQGIVHVIGPEQGFTLPGATVVCADSHTSTHGAFGCLAFGIGTSEVEHVLATQTLRTPQPKSMLVQVDGVLPRGTSGKDLILHLIGIIGTGGGTGYVIEYQGEAIRALSMDGRMTVSNMTIEGGARAGLIAPDEKTFAYLKGRPKTPQGAEWDAAMAFWKTIATDPGAKFDKTVRIDVSEIAPTITWGTSPEDVVPITGRVPDPSVLDVPEKRKAMERAIAYMGLLPGQPMADLKVDRVFIGSCTNSRLEDMRMAAEVVKGRKVASHIVEAMISPGSWAVKKQAEDEGLDKIFTDAGFQWRESGCSMCAGMNLDRANPYERVASTNNRNFEGRQGRNARTHLVSPAMAAAAAIAGRLVDVREYLN